MCDVSHLISRVFLAWFPEETRPRAAACPPLPSTPEEERGSSSRVGSESPALPVHPSQPPAHPSAASWLPNVGEGRSTARETSFCTMRIALKPNYPKSLWSKLSQALDQRHAPYGEIIPPASCSPPSRSLHVITTSRHLYGLWVMRHPPWDHIYPGMVLPRCEEEGGCGQPGQGSPGSSA